MKPTPPLLCLVLALLSPASQPIVPSARAGDAKSVLQGGAAASPGTVAPLPQPSGPLPKENIPYTADTIAPATRQGAVSAAGVTWQCQGSRCVAKTAWRDPTAEHCHALAVQVGAVKAFGTGGRQLTPAQLAHCNQGLVLAPASTSSAAVGSAAPPKPGGASPAAVRKPVLPVTARPSSIDFGELWSGDSRKKAVSVGVGADGNVTAVLSPANSWSKYFRIAKMEVYGIPPSHPGAIVKPPGPLRPPKIDPGKGGGPSQGGGGPSQGGGGSVPQQAPQQAGPAQALDISHQLLASTTAAPFVLSAKQGDSVYVTLDFTPDPNIFSGTAVGEHNATLGVTGAGWRADVPVHASYAGVRVGTTGLLDPKEVDVVIPEAYDPKRAYPLTLNVTLVNVDKQPHQVAITPSNLPKWLKFSGQSVNVPAEKTVKTPLALQITSFSDVPRGKPIAEIAAELSMQYGGTTKKLPFSLRVLPGWFSWSFDGSGWWATMTIRSDGRTTFVFACPKGYGLDIDHKCRADFYLGGSLVYPGLVVFGDDRMNSVTVPRPYVEQQYVNLLTATPYVKAPNWNPDDAQITYGKPR